MLPSDIATSFGSFAAIGALLFGSVQLGGARMTRYVAGVAFLFTLAIGVWAIAVSPIEFSLGNIWKFGMLYGIMFLAVFLERSARKEEAEEQLSKTPEALRKSQRKGYRLGVAQGEKVAWQDRKLRYEADNKARARTNAIDALTAFCTPEHAKIVLDKLRQELSEADHAALLLVAQEVKDSGILVAREVADQGSKVHRVDTRQQKQLQEPEDNE